MKSTHLIKININCVHGPARIAKGPPLSDQPYTSCDQRFILDQWTHCPPACGPCESTKTIINEFKFRPPTSWTSAFRAAAPIH
jgi:hypothetical protein